MNMNNMTHEQNAARFNAHKAFSKQLKNLNGLCMGLLADNHLNDGEIDFLYQFILECKDLKDVWPYYFLLNKIENILEDGIITEEERLDLENTLKSFIGGTLEETGATSGMSSSLPLTPAPQINFEDKSFCFTGQFSFGKRQKCQDTTEAQGAKISKGVNLSLDYLVIGNLASEFWIETSYGRKIQKACEYNDQKKANIQIISERDWVRQLH